MTLIAVRSAKSHAHLSHDHDLSGPQKFHVQPVPRIGGLGIVLAALAGALGDVVAATARPASQAFAAAGLRPARLRGRPDRRPDQERQRRAAPAGHGGVGAAGGVAARCRASCAPPFPGLDWVVSFPVGGGAGVGVRGRRRGQFDQHHRRLQWPGVDVRRVDPAVPGLCGLPGRRPAGGLAGAGRRGRRARLLRLELPGRPDLPGRRRRLFPGLLHCRTGDPAAAPQPDGVADVPAAAVHLPGVRDGVLDLPAPLPARHAAEHARRHPPAFADLPARHALGGRQPQRQGADAAQLDDLAVPVAAVHVRGHPVGAVLGQHGRAVGADRAVRRQLRGAVLAHRALQVAALAGVSGAEPTAAVHEG